MPPIAQTRATTLTIPTMATPISDITTTLETTAITMAATELMDLTRSTMTTAMNGAAGTTPSATRTSATTTISETGVTATDAMAAPTGSRTITATSMAAGTLQAILTLLTPPTVATRTHTALQTDIATAP